MNAYQSNEQSINAATTIDSTATGKHAAPKYKADGGIMKAQQGNTLDWDAWIKADNKEMYERNRQADQRYFKSIEEEEAAKKAIEAEARATAILTYGTIGIVLLFFVATIVVFYILYTRRNKDNPYINKN